MQLHQLVVVEKPVRLASMVSAGGSTVLGFSLMGSTLPAGDGLILTTLTVSGSPTGLSAITISDAVGGALEFCYGIGAMKR